MYKYYMSRGNLVDGVLAMAQLCCDRGVGDLYGVHVQAGFDRRIEHEKRTCSVINILLTCCDEFFLFVVMFLYVLYIHVYMLI